MSELSENQKHKLFFWGIVIIIILVLLLWRFPIPRYTLQTVNKGATHKLDRWTGNVYLINSYGERLIPKRSN